MGDVSNKIVTQVLKKVRDRRKSLGLSHENMAFELNMSPSAYNKLERFETTLSLERLLKISEILKMSISEVFEIKTGDILNQELKDNSIGKVETLYQENKDIYEKLLKSKDEQITLLKNLLDEKLKTHG